MPRDLTTLEIRAKFADLGLVSSVGPPTEPEVHHARTFLFAAEFCLHEFAVTGIFANYIFTQPFLRICS